MTYTMDDKWPFKSIFYISYQNNLQNEFKYEQKSNKSQEPHVWDSETHNQMVSYE